jgi:hypothetical protein
MLLVMVISAIHNTARLYRQEPIPVGKPLPAANQTKLPFTSIQAQRAHGESQLGLQ